MGELWHKLSYAFFEDIEDQVGIISRGKKLESCLAIGLNDVRRFKLCDRDDCCSIEVMGSVFYTVPQIVVKSILFNEVT